MNIQIKNLPNGISIVKINEPKTYNALSFQNLTDLIKAFKKLDNDKKTNVIILEGAGKGFSAGHNGFSDKGSVITFIYLITIR